MIFRLSRPVAVRTAVTFAAAMTLVVAVGTVTGAGPQASVDAASAAIVDARG